jgi:nitrilase
MIAERFTVAAVQAAPVFLDHDATVEKACALIAEAASQGARLVVLPETFIPAYPAWVWFLPLTRRADLARLYRRMVEQSVGVPGPATERIARAAREAGVWVAIGVTERNSEASGSSLYNTLLLFDDRGELVERRRKLMPTGGERMVWTPGEPVPLRVRDTPFGRLGSLICWENYMPLARYALWEQGAQLHLAPTWDKADQWIASMRHIAREGRVFVVSCCQALHRDQVPADAGFKDLLPAGMEWINSGNSMIVDPDGIVIAGPVADRETILLAEIDPGQAHGSRWIFDAAGHYNRPDLFSFAQRGADAPPPLARAPARRTPKPKGGRAGSAKPARGVSRRRR